MSVAILRILHVKCRNTFYPRSESVNRFSVPDDKVDWDTSWDEYQPVEYTAPFIKGQVWADPEIGGTKFNPRWNSVDGKVNRKSFEGAYKVVDSRPLNVFGRTGIKGRGVLGRWGPNHAADPIVTRWKRDKSNRVTTDKVTKLPVLQFVAIKRRDSGEWAIPGGMVDPGEVVTSTLKREFLEEALNILGNSAEDNNELTDLGEETPTSKREYLEQTLNSLENSDEIKNELSERLNSFFNQGKEIYKGYVDDPRNTDNAWMETVAMQFHDESGKLVGSLPFNAGDDAVGVQWMDLGKTLKLYASHYDIVKKVAETMKCHW